MSMKIKPNQTRGRPKKDNSQDPQKRYFSMFSMNVQVVYQLSLMYVMQVFADIKEERRLAIFQSGFTIYDKQFPNYSFDTFQKNITDWEAKRILENDQLRSFAKSLVAIGPTVIYKQLIAIINLFLFYKEKNSSSNSLTRLRYELIFQKDDVLNKKFPFLRFSSEKLRTLKFQSCNEQINPKVKKLWQIFVYIYTYSIYACNSGSNYNKFLLNLSTEAPQHMQTLMDHPNLQQVIQMVEPHLNDKIDKIRIRGYHLKMSETAAQEYGWNEKTTGLPKKCQQLNSSDSNQLDIEPQQQQFKIKNFQKDYQRQKLPPKSFQKRIFEQQFQSDQVEFFRQKSISSMHQVLQKQQNKNIQLIMANERVNFNNPITADQITPYNQFNQNPRKRVKVSSIITQNLQQNLKAFQAQSQEIWNSKKEQKIEGPTEPTQSTQRKFFNFEPFDSRLISNPKKSTIQTTIIKPIKQQQKQQQCSKQK